MATLAPDLGKRARPRPRKALRRALRKVHRVAGLFTAAYTLMACLTGAALLFRAEIVAAAHPGLGPSPPDRVAQAQLLASRLAPGSFTAIRFPDEGLAAFVVHRPDRRTQLFDAASLEAVPDRLGANRLMDWLFDLHHFLLAGETGRIISGLFGLAIAALVVIGLYLWWPWRRSWSLAHVRPARPSRAARLTAHATVGIVVAPALLLAAVTGSAIVFNQTARSLLGGLLGSADAAIGTDQHQASLSAQARRLFPAATPRLLLPPDAGGVPALRLREAQELHPNGRSTLTYDPGSRRAVAATSDARSGVGDKVYNSFYPLHTGHAGGLPMRLLLLASALLAAFATLLGVGSWLAGRRGKPRFAAGRPPQ